MRIKQDWSSSVWLRKMLQIPCLNTWVIMMIDPSYLLMLLSHTLELYDTEVFRYLEGNWILIFQDVF